MIKEYVLSADVDGFEKFPEFIPAEKYSAVQNAIDAKRGLTRSLTGEDALFYPKSDSEEWARKYIKALEAL